MYGILADLVLLLHLLFILWVCLGWIAVRFRRWVMWLHLPAALWGVAIEFMGWPCPLTPLEQHLRERAGQEGYEGGFIEHYLEAVIYPVAMGRTTQILLGVAVLVVNLAAYLWIFSRRSHSKAASR